MKRAILSAAFAAALLAPGAALADGKPATLYKNPQCSCCDAYAKYLERNGFEVTVKPTHDMSNLRRMAGVPEESAGCHLTMIDGYAVEGHVPIGAVNKLLEEKPSVKGISLPGMPQGSPGMSGRKDGPFTIHTIGEEKQVFWRE